MSNDYIQIDTLISLLRQYPYKVSIQRVQKAWQFAKTAHEGQKRLTGEPYAYHGLATAIILAEWRLDVDSIIAGLLHDVIEDAYVSKDTLEKEFGKQVVYIVGGVTKVSTIRLRGSGEEEYIENLRKMFLAMAKDLRVVLVKLADRTHNLRTLYALPEEKRKIIAKETVEIYAPLAERLGMGQVKGELDDLAFPYLYPDEYKRLKKESKIYYKRSEEIIKKMKKKLLTLLAKEEIRALINTRKKHYYSLWKKLSRDDENWDFNKIHDIVALRIIVDKVWQCYTALGITHLAYKPVANIGISDFIAQPKPNGYRSIHTKVFGPDGRICEVQIRTKTMHEEAEFGIAAHWAYSDAKDEGKRDETLEKGLIGVNNDKLRWVKQLSMWQKEISDTKEYLKAVKFDALGHRIYIYSPIGDVYDLPDGATPVDFAYAVHTQLGSYIKSVRVNSKIVPLDYRLKSGDMVEIVKYKDKKKPSLRWLDFVVTTLAKREIKKTS